MLGVIDAADSRQLEAALAQLAGGLAGRLNGLRDAMLDLLAHLEAGLDFPDEEIEFITRDELDRQLQEASRTISQLLRQMTERGQAGDLSRVVLVGSPNTGKSSLFNALAEAGRAIVSDHPGTTRDYVAAELDLDGLRCLLLDTAGVEPNSDAPSARGRMVPSALPSHPFGSPDRGSDSAEIGFAAQAISSAQARSAQLQILCLDATRTLNAWEKAEITHPEGRILVMTKIDGPHRCEPVPSAHATSVVTGEGIESLKARIRAALLAPAAHHSGGDIVASTAARCRETLQQASEALARAWSIHQSAAGEELVAAEIRVALDELAQAVGAVYTDDVLDRVFSRFCIGK